MEDNKWEKLEEILHEKVDLTGQMMGVGTDPYTHIQESLSVKMKRDPEVIKKLEALGFKVIYPAEISENDQKRLEEIDISDKYTYELRRDNALIVDTQLQHHSMSLAEKIAEHYFSLGKEYASDYGVDIGGIGSNQLFERMSEGFRAQHENEFDEILKSVGFETEKAQNIGDMSYLKIHTDGQIYPVKQSKFSQIYMNAKDKIQGMFNKIKAIVKPKTKEKENDSNER